MDMETKTQVLISENDEGNHVKQEHFHVLAVDDSIIERKMLEKLLTISSYHVTCVESGDKALEFLGLVNCHSPVTSDEGDHVDDAHHHDHHDDDVHDNGHGHGDDDDDDDMICNSPPSSDDAHPQEQGQGTRVNLIMTDYSMPGMSGYDLLKRVKESSWKDVPVVVMSSENVPSRIHMCLEEGAEEFLLKPVRMSDLKKLQPRIHKSTASTSTCKYCCESGNKTTLFAANDNGSIISKEEITIGDDHEDYNSKTNEGKEEEIIKLKNELEKFAKISKLDQFVM